MNAVNEISGHYNDKQSFSYEIFPNAGSGCTGTHNFLRYHWLNCDIWQIFVRTIPNVKNKVNSSQNLSITVEYLDTSCLGYSLYISGLRI